MDKVYLPARAKQETSSWTLFRNISFFIFAGSFLGYTAGEKSSDKENKDKYLTQFKNEDQLYYILDREKKPIFIFYMIPGERYCL